MKILMQVQGVLFCLITPKSDQHLFSRNNINTSSRAKVMRINKIITEGKTLWSFIKFSQLILEGSVWRSVWRICVWILEHKGLKLTQIMHWPCGDLSYFFFFVKKTIPGQLLKWTKVIATAEYVCTVCKFEIANLVTSPAWQNHFQLHN